MERPGCRHGEGDLDRAVEVFAALRRRPDVNRRGRFGGKLLAASFEATRAAAIVEEDATALVLL